jgi:hypothetical protein
MRGKRWAKNKAIDSIALAWTLGIDSVKKAIQLSASTSAHEQSTHSLSEAESRSMDLICGMPLDAVVAIFNVLSRRQAGPYTSH